MQISVERSEHLYCILHEYHCATLSYLCSIQSCVKSVVMALSGLALLKGLHIMDIFASCKSRILQAWLVPDLKCIKHYGFT
jgi:hypothetical protein